MPEKLLCSDNSELITECTTLIGHLSSFTRKKLIDVLNNPCERTWNRAYHIVISSHRYNTLWQAVIAVNPGFQRCKASKGKWFEIPSQLTICQAIKLATTEIQER